MLEIKTLISHWPKSQAYTADRRWYRIIDWCQGVVYAYKRLCDKRSLRISMHYIWREIYDLFWSSYFSIPGSRSSWSSCKYHFHRSLALNLLSISWNVSHSLELTLPWTVVICNARSSSDNEVYVLLLLQVWLYINKEEEGGEREREKCHSKQIICFAIKRMPFA